MIRLLIFALVALTLLIPALATSVTPEPLPNPSTIPLTGGLDLQPCENGFFFVVTPVSDTTILAITLNFGAGPVDVPFTLGPNDGQATVTLGGTIVSGSVLVNGANTNSNFNLSHCLEGETPVPTASPTATSTDSGGGGGGGSGTPTPTPSLVITTFGVPTDTETPRLSPTETPSDLFTPTATETAIPTPTETPTDTSTEIPTETPTPTEEVTPTPTRVPTGSPSATPTPATSPTSVPPIAVTTIVSTPVATSALRVAQQLPDTGGRP